jgi:hypothetical protein
MDNPTDTLDQTDEDILTYTVSDEALEAATGIERRGLPRYDRMREPASGEALAMAGLYRRTTA